MSVKILALAEFTLKPELDILHRKILSGFLKFEAGSFVVQEVISTFTQCRCLQSEFLCIRLVINCQ